MKSSRTRAFATRNRACVRILGGGDDDATWNHASRIASQLSDPDEPRGYELAKAIRTVRAAGGRVSKSDVMVACNCDCMDHVGLLFPEVLEALTTDKFCDKDTLARAEAHGWRGRGGES